MVSSVLRIKSSFQERESTSSHHFSLRSIIINLICFYFVFSLEVAGIRNDHQKIACQMND